MKTTFLKIKESRWTSRLLSPIILLLIIIAFSIATDGRFSSSRNITMIIQQALTVETVATGAVFICSTGNGNISMEVET